MNPYDVLGISPSASDEEVARAYKRLAKRYHPDLNPGNAAAAEQMGRINRAYDDIKAMRQRGNAWEAGGVGQSGRAYDFHTGRSYCYTYRPRHSPIGMLIAVLVVFFLVRLLISVIFGGFGGSYYVNPGYGTAPGGYYSYYQTVTFGR